MPPLIESPMVDTACRKRGDKGWSCREVVGWDNWNSGVSGEGSELVPPDSAPLSHGVPLSPALISLQPLVPSGLSCGTRLLVNHKACCPHHQGQAQKGGSIAWQYGMGAGMLAAS